MFGIEFFHFQVEERRSQIFYLCEALMSFINNGMEEREVLCTTSPPPSSPEPEFVNI
jgi:hypothetical protein